MTSSPYVGPLYNVCELEKCADDDSRLHIAALLAAAFFLQLVVYNSACIAGVWQHRIIVGIYGPRNRARHHAGRLIVAAAPARVLPRARGARGRAS